MTVARVLSTLPTREHDDHRRRAAGATQIRLASYSTETTTGTNAPTNNGPIIGQPIVLDTGANQEVISVKRHISPAARGAGAERRC